MPYGFLYVVDRDFGFAPNPFHGYCTLGTCKPRIRRAAERHDWIIGLGGARLTATNRCVFAMEVTEKITFNEYWYREEFRDKRPVRNGSRRMLVGDNIYYKDEDNWIQADSHHSLQGGLPNPANISKDTKVDSVLVSKNFFYFGKQAVLIPKAVLDGLGYRNGIGHRKFGLEKLDSLLGVISKNARNQVISDPFDFDVAASRYSGVASRITR